MDFNHVLEIIRAVGVMLGSIAGSIAVFIQTVKHINDKKNKKDK